MFATIDAPGTRYIKCMIKKDGVYEKISSVNVDKRIYDKSRSHPIKANLQKVAAEVLSYLSPQQKREIEAVQVEVFRLHYDVQKRSYSYHLINTVVVENTMNQRAK